MKVRNACPIWRRAIRSAGARLFHWAENNGNSSFERNGELWLLRSMLRAHAGRGASGNFVAVDAGANMGTYTTALLSEAARARCAIEVHAFEPSPACADVLRSSFANQPAVHVVAAALADDCGDAALYSGAQGSSQASLIQRDPSLQPDARHDVMVRRIRLADYLESESIERVDLLKLDVEGSELSALEGLGARLTPDCVRLVQFEYGGTTLDAGVTLGRLMQLLQARGYRVGKLFPHAVELRSYAPWMEHFAYSNYVALSPDCAERP